MCTYMYTHTHTHTHRQPYMHAHASKILLNHNENAWFQTYIITVKELWPDGSVRVEHGFPVNSSGARLYHVIHDLHRGATYSVSVALDVINARESNVVQIVMSE